jgi:hypothetical protein
MAVEWGAWEDGSSTNGERVGVEITMSPSVVGVSTTYVDITVDYWVDSEYDINDTQTLTYGGTCGGGQQSFDLTSSSARKILSVGGRFNTSYTSTTDISATGEISGHYAGATPFVGHHFYIPKRPAAPPDAPPLIGASSITSSSAHLDWSAPDNNGSSIDSYQLIVDNQSDFSSINYVNTNAGGEETVTGLARATTYYWKVRAHNGAGWGPYSAAKSFRTDATVPDAPDAPTFSSVAATSAHAAFTGNSNGGAGYDSFQIQVATNSSFTSGLQTYTGGVANATFSGLTRATTYYSRARAHNAIGWGPYSTTSSFTTLTTVPSAPQALVAGTATSDSIPLGWAAPADNGGAAITGYNIQAINPANVVKSYSVGNVLSTTLTGLSPGVEYDIRIQAVNARGPGAWTAYVVRATISGIKVKVAGQWLNAKLWVKVGGVWVPAKVWKKVGGSWVV